MLVDPVPEPIFIPPLGAHIVPIHLDPPPLPLAITHESVPDGEVDP